MRARLATAAAALLVLLALVLPDDYGALRAAAFVRLPVEALVAVAVLVLLPARARRGTAVALGVLLGLVTVVKLADLGFTAFLDRPFDLVLDWWLLGSATGVVEDSAGRLGVAAAVLVAVLLVAAVPVLSTLAVLRLTRLAAAHRTATARAGAVLAVAWLACAALGAQLVPGVPVAARADAALLKDRAVAVRTGLHDRQAFAAEAAADPYRDVPGGQLLSGLRGKDVLVTFVESYGRSALADPGLSVGPVLDGGTRELAAAGYGARSAFLTSSTVGGASWLAHATLLSGLQVDNQQRYRTLVASDRLTLPRAFGRAGWRTVSVEPAITEPWPEGRFFGYTTAYDSRNLGYRGPRFSYSPMPDQYALAAFQRAERGPGHAPVFGEITLTSSHTPFSPVPKAVDWAAVGDGSVFASARTAVGVGRPAYRASIGYSLSTLVSYVRTYGGDDLVLVVLGDHQPSPVITGRDAGRDVPVTIVARDRRVLDRVAGWGWQPGLRPSPAAPVWAMKDFRDRFLTAYGPAAH